jgi:hypothetical protein
MPKYNVKSDASGFIAQLLTDFAAIGVFEYYSNNRSAGETVTLETTKGKVIELSSDSYRRVG